MSDTKKPLQKFKVIWELDVEAGSSEAAVAKARALWNAEEAQPSAGTLDIVDIEEAKAELDRNTAFSADVNERQYLLLLSERQLASIEAGLVVVMGLGDELPECFSGAASRGGAFARLSPDELRELLASVVSKGCGRREPPTSCTP